MLQVFNMLTAYLGLAVWTALWISPADAQSNVLWARVSIGGVKGTVNFTQLLTPSAVTLTFDLRGQNADKVKAWQIHTFHVDYDVEDPCALENLGNRVLPAVGGVVEPKTRVDGYLTLGQDSIEGRSLALLDSEDHVIACATVERPTDYVTARATFHHGILGTVVFRQAAYGYGLSKHVTRVTSDLFEKGSRTAENEGKLQWWLLHGQVNYCSSGVLHHSCEDMDFASCFAGNDVSQQFSSIAIGSRKGDKRVTFLDDALTLSFYGNIVGQTLVVFDPSKRSPAACAVIRKYVTRHGLAVFDMDGVSGVVNLTQSSPLDPTLVLMELSNLRGMAGGYHVHQWPVPQRVLADQDLCSSQAVGGHFNPFHVEHTSDYPGPRTGTEDQYEVGDLSGKYGLLSSPPLNGIHQTVYVDWNLPLFGPHSVLGRSIVIHKSAPGAPRWVCANVLDTAILTSAVATFTYPVIGHVLFRQQLGHEESETWVYVELSYADGSAMDTSGHDWFIGGLALTDDALTSDVTTRCCAAGHVINPFDVPLSEGEEGEGCGTDNQLLCPAGDMSGKHGTVSVARNGTFAKGYFTDVNLPLMGDNSIVGKTLVLMSPSGGTTRLDCAVIQKVWPARAVAKMRGPDGTPVSVTLEQATGIIRVPTSISLPPFAQGIQIEVQPTLYLNRCNNDLGLHSTYNPYHAAINTTWYADSSDQLAIGALWEKVHKMTWSSAFVFNDTTLDLFGMRSVIMRSFWLPSLPGCADIIRSGVPGGLLVQAQAVFSPPVMGNIILRQYVYPDGSLSDTTVIVDLRVSGTQTVGHKWYTHEHPVSADKQADSGRCESTGGIYNPFGVDTTRYWECGPTNPLRCRVGDQAAKLGTYDMLTGPLVFTDVQLPLVGPFSVMGRSMVVMEAGGGTVMGCGDVMPDHNPHYVELSIQNSGPRPVDVHALQSVVSRALNTPSYNVVVQVWRQDQHCLTLRIHFLGLPGQELQYRFKDLLGDNSDILGYPIIPPCGEGIIG